VPAAWIQGASFGVCFKSVASFYHPQYLSRTSPLSIQRAWNSRIWHFYLNNTFLPWRNLWNLVFATLKPESMKLTCQFRRFLARTFRPVNFLYNSEYENLMFRHSSSDSCWIFWKPLLVRMHLTTLYTKTYTWYTRKKEYQKVASSLLESRATLSRDKFSFSDSRVTEQIFFVTPLGRVNTFQCVKPHTRGSSVLTYWLVCPGHPIEVFCTVLPRNPRQGFRPVKKAQLFKDWPPRWFLRKKI